MSDHTPIATPASGSRLAIRIIILAIILGSAVVGRVTWMTLHRAPAAAPAEQRR
jgi:flagellar basal body-associated protein FliL